MTGELLSDPLIPLLNRRLVELDEAHGSDSLATDVAHALQHTLRSYRGPVDRRSILKTLLEFHDVMLACRPRMPNVIFDLQRAILHVKDNSQAGLDDVVACIEELIGEKRARRAQVAGAATVLFNAPQVALVHSYSGTLLAILRAVLGDPSSEKPHQIIVASQSAGKTRALVRTLQELKARHTIVPEYGISHVISRATVALFGALTVTHSQVILGPGSGSLLAQLAHGGVPSYVALSTDKMSFWKESTEPAFTRTHRVKNQDVEYERLSFSHDFVPLSLFAGIITEDRVHPISEVPLLFSRLEQEFRRRADEIERLRGSLD